MFTEDLRVGCWVGYVMLLEKQRTFILQQKKSWTTSAIIPSIMGESIEELKGLESDSMLPNPTANHWNASDDASIVWAISRT